MPIRSGHFSFPVQKRANNTSPFGSEVRRLSFGGAGTIVRVFNSTERYQFDRKYFRVANKRASDPYPAEEVDQNLYPTMSIDVFVVANGAETGVEVVGHNGIVDANGGTSAFEGSYDLVRTANGTLMNDRRRSGRFNFPSAVPNELPVFDAGMGMDVNKPLFPVLLADLSDLTTGSVMYRIQNTGDKTFKVSVAANRGAINAGNTVELAAAQGIDTAVQAGYSLFVSRPSAGDEMTRDAIRGVYEIVG